MYSSAGLHDKMNSICSNSVTLSRVIVAINVGCDSDGTYYISDERQRGVHWAVLIIDLNCSKSYYGDSLGWPLPSNLREMVGANLKRLEGDLGISITSLQDINKLSCDADNSSYDLHKWFLPITVMFTCVWCNCGVYGWWL